jgi:hypothetical protein
MNIERRLLWAVDSKVGEPSLARDCLNPFAFVTLVSRYHLLETGKNLGAC